MAFDNLTNKPILKKLSEFQEVYKNVLLTLDTDIDALKNDFRHLKSGVQKTNSTNQQKYDLLASRVISIEREAAKIRSHEIAVDQFKRELVLVKSEFAKKPDVVTPAPHVNQEVKQHIIPDKIKTQQENENYIKRISILETRVTFLIAAFVINLIVMVCLILI
tara:strand:- start:391 stop:879 length:489 start_codon:yes stop_codon:yes gene_type:complete